MSAEEEPSGTVVFCDDVRREVDGKLSFVGVYPANTMFVNGQFPQTISKLCAFIVFSEPKEMAFRRDFPLKLQVYFPGQIDKTTHEQTFPHSREAVEMAFAASITPADYDGPMYAKFMSILALSPATFETGGTVRIFMDYNGKRIRCGILTVTSAPGPVLVR
jgi:hypothetical protein